MSNLRFFLAVFMEKFNERRVNNSSGFFHHKVVHIPCLFKLKQNNPDVFYSVTAITSFTLLKCSLCGVLYSMLIIYSSLHVTVSVGYIQIKDVRKGHYKFNDYNDVTFMKFQRQTRDNIGIGSRNATQTRNLRFKFRLMCDTFNCIRPLTCTFD